MCVGFEYPCVCAWIIFRGFWAYQLNPQEISCKPVGTTSISQLRRYGACCLSLITHPSNFGDRNQRHGWMVPRISQLFSGTWILPHFTCGERALQNRDFTETNQVIVKTKPNLSQEAGLMSWCLPTFLFFLLRTDLLDAKWARARADQPWTEATLTKRLKQTSHCKHAQSLRGNSEQPKGRF